MSLTTALTATTGDPNMLLITYSLDKECIQIFSGQAALAGQTTRVTEITVTNGKDVRVSHRDFNPAAGTPRHAPLGKTDKSNEAKVIEMVRESVRKQDYYWYILLPGMITDLGWQLQFGMIRQGRDILEAHFGH
jgi:hypothetical protein